MPEYGSTERHPFASLLLLLVLALAGMVVSLVIGLLLGGAIFGLQPLFDVLYGRPAANLNFLKFIQIVSSAGMFIVPSLVFARLESKHWMSYLNLHKFSLILIVITSVIMFSVAPVLEWSVELNKSMKLPGFLKFIEDWMRNKENQMAELTKHLLIMNSAWAFAVNLLMFAIIPAVGEELIFRGCLQKIFTRWIGNYHWGIWLTAIIFSAIHVQFYGFIPRMLLGALFGYLLVWSKSLWLPMLAHFINNAAAVITAYIYQQRGISLDKLDQAKPQAWPIYLVSFVATSALLWAFYNQTVKQKSELIKEENGKGLG